MAEKKYPDRNHGKQMKQRLKPYIVLQYLLRNTDEEHFATGKDIEGYLREICDIYAERRSIYKDIDEINEVNWMLENDATKQKRKQLWQMMNTMKKSSLFMTRAARDIT